MTELMDSTGFQSSRRMFRQILPSRSMFGWNTCVCVCVCVRARARVCG